MDLAGSSLEFLCCEESLIVSEVDRALGTKIGSFRGLTGLELKNYDGQQLTSYLHPVSQLGLVELRLTGCRRLSPLRISSNSFAALKTLHVEDNPLLSLHPHEGLEEANELRMLGCQLLALPSLQQISGHSTLLDGMAFYLRNWPKSKYEGQDEAQMSVASSHKMWVWRKPVTKVPKQNLDRTGRDVVSLLESLGINTR